ncbi:RDD family protein [Naumannella sp. ID2617S]|uniref:RDD family protein n=1 Tax=Enemella dayhoffiae TaxID=2016507 RepID=UPI00114024C5|nr:RDD family protein [Enemella dayhoffiae]NNG20260.1 RDD family protein [Naumannella sp. ID2617S]
MSDEIPVGSPPAPPGRHAAPGGWYADPANQGQERYWDGWQWTRNTRPSEPSGQFGEPGFGPPGGAAYAPGPGHGHPRVPAQPWGQGSYGQHQAYGPPIPQTADGVPLASWGWRLLAYVIDWILISVVTEVISQVTGLGAAIQRGMSAYLAYLTEISTTGGTPDLGYAISLITPPEMYILQAVTLACFVIYHGLMLRFRGASLGKLACGLRVVPAEQGHAPVRLPWGTALLRPLVTRLLGLVPLLGLIDYLFPLWDRRRQTLHDKVVKTQVVRNR